MYWFISHLTFLWMSVYDNCLDRKLHHGVCVTDGSRRHLVECVWNISMHQSACGQTFDYKLPFFPWALLECVYACIGMLGTSGESQNALLCNMLEKAKFNLFTC